MNLERQAIPVLAVLPENKVLKDHPVYPEEMAKRVNLENMCPVRLHLDLLAAKEKWVHLDLPDHQVSKERLEKQDHKALKVIKATPDLMENLDLPEPPDKMDQLDLWEAVTIVLHLERLQDINSISYQRTSTFSPSSWLLSLFSHHILQRDSNPAAQNLSFFNSIYPHTTTLISVLTIHISFSINQITRLSILFANLFL